MFGFDFFDSYAWADGRDYAVELAVSEADRAAVFGRLFPQGFTEDVLGELAPDGWQQSPLVAVFHPSAEPVYDEARRMHENIQ